jgi:predicted CoA-substrate-specific enzyme activase
MRIVAGIDVGSAYTKAVLLDDDRQVVGTATTKSGALHDKAAEESLRQALRGAGVNREEIDYIISTGYGRARVPLAQETITELTCHAFGAKTLCPEAEMIIDIGGQDSKVIHVNEDGSVSRFVMNDRCAAGTGRFLELMASVLDLSLVEMGTLALEARNRTNISHVCAVFAESEVISLIALGNERADIAAAIFRAIARRIEPMVRGLGLREKVVMSGGVAKNVGAVWALEERLALRLIIPSEPQIVGAYGAALLALKRLAVAART